MKTISSNQLEEALHKEDAILIDVRTPEEYHLEHIEGAINMPLDRFESYKKELKKHKTVICYCNSGNSSSQFCKRAEHAGLTNIVNLSGGISACKTKKKIKQKGALPMMQQVQITAGGLVLLGIILARLLHQYTRHEYFIGISAFVGAGLVFAGFSGRCGMAKLLAKMPWNTLQGKKHTTEVIGKNLIIKQFEDKNLSHYSYVAISNGEAIVVDPERDPEKYYNYVKDHNAKIIGIMNTHPHADFASGHLQIHEDTGATIYVGEKVGAEYQHTSLQGGEKISFGSASIISYFTPGHSPDSISYLVKDEEGKEISFFTGDWLFLGDVGRADLRESVGNIKAKQEELAGMMYDTTRDILPALDGKLTVLPAHGAGTSCGKGLSKQNMDSLENQRMNNPMLQNMTKDDFINQLTSEQPAIPAYFTNSVLLNKKGNSSFKEAIDAIQYITSIPNDDTVIIIDSRSWDQVTNYPLHENAIVIDHTNTGFTGMIGTIINPNQKFIIIVDKKSEVNKVVHNIISIGYEQQLQGVYCVEDNRSHHHIIHKHDLETSGVVILDVRSESTFIDNSIFPEAINVPIEQLISKIDSLDKNITYVPYCGGVFKSSIALSILGNYGYKAKKMYV